MKINSVTSFLPTVVAAAGLVIASSAFSPPANAYGVTATNAITLNSGDKGRTLDPIEWLVPSGSVGTNATLPVNLSAKALVTVDDFTETALKLTIKITNTTISSFQSALVSFGFAVAPDATSLTTNAPGQVFDNLVLQDGKQNFPGGFKNIDFCASADNCAGGNINNGLQSGGNSDIVSFTLGGKFSSGVTIASYPAKFQTSAGSFEVAGVPEPLTVVGSGLALGFGALLKRETSRKRNKALVKSKLSD